MIAKLLISLSLRVRVEKIEKILLEHNLSPNHPDLLYLPYESKLGIAEARKIKDHFAYKSFSGKIKAVVLEDASNLTVEAQNALLKTLEELPEDALFILGADSDSKLLPTVVSRCQVVTLTEHSEYNNYNDYINKLISLSIEERFEYIEKLKDREEFLYQMVSFFHQQLAATHERGRPFGSEPQVFDSEVAQTRGGRRLLNLKQFLQELLQAEEWAKQNVNIRAILEYLMLVMPKIV